jgi:hypothetical protein
MKLFFRIDTEGAISAYPNKSEARKAVAEQGGQIFANEAEWNEIAMVVPMQGLIATWNSLPEVSPVRKFKDRATAAIRIWEVVDGTLAPAMAASFTPKCEAKEKRPKATATEPKAADTTFPTPDTTTPTPAREGSKKAQALEMLKRGTTREELQTAFGWLPHTTRGFLSILGKAQAIEVTKGEDGVRTYRLAS